MPFLLMDGSVHSASINVILLSFIICLLILNIHRWVKLSCASHLCLSVRDVISNNLLPSILIYFKYLSLFGNFFGC